MFFDAFQTLESERLTLRAWTRFDADALYDYASQPDVGPSAGWMPHRNKAESLRFLEDVLLNNPLAWAMHYKPDNLVIGCINLRNDEKRTAARCYALGFSMSKEYWGHGIMPEAAALVIPYAFESLKARLVSCYHYPQNTRSQRVIEKCGFKYEGRLRLCAQLDNGEVFDELCYSMTRHEYERSFRK